MSAPALELIPDTTMALTFCRALFGDEPTEFRDIHPHNGTTRHTWGYPETEADLESCIKSNCEGYGVFVVINRADPAVVEPRTLEGKGARDRDITGIRALFVEVDKDEASPGDNLRELLSGSLRPSLIVSSSLPHKLHAYWLTADVPIAEFRIFQAQLIEHFGAGPESKNLSRILRVPGFYHTKGEPIMSTLIEANGTMYTRAELIEAFDLKRELPKPPAPKPVLTVSDHQRKYALAALDGEAQRVASSLEGGRNHTLNQAAFSLGQLVGAGALGRTTVEGVLLDATLSCGLDHPEARKTIASGLSSGELEPRDLSNIGAKESTYRVSVASGGGDTSGTSSNDGPRTYRSLPMLQVNNRLDREIAQEALEHLVRANEAPFVFLRGERAIVTMDAGLELSNVTSDKDMQILLQQHMSPVKITEETREDDNGKKTPVECINPSRIPQPVAAHVMRDRPHPFPELKAISTIPVLMPNGEFLTESGYHPESGYLMRLEGLEGLRTNMSSEAALELLIEVFQDFEFLDAMIGFAATLAMLLQAFVRVVIGSHTPLYYIESPTAGTGKTLLAKIMHIIHTGHPLHPAILVPDDNELNKFITAELLAGRQHIVFDNVDKRVYHQSLLAAITSTKYKGRKLGVSEILLLDNNALWVITGNNVEFDYQFNRRIVPIILQSGSERPETRTGFALPDVLGHVLKHRTELVSALLSLIQSWVDAGMPEGKTPYAGFERYAKVIGGILEHHGLSQYLDHKSVMYEGAVSEQQEWSTFVSLWFETCRSREVTAGELLQLARGKREILDVWTDGTGKLKDTQSLGYALKQQRNRIFGAHRLVMSYDAHKKTNVYSLQPNEAEKRQSLKERFSKHRGQQSPRNPPQARDAEVERGDLRGVESPISFEKEQINDSLAFDDLVLDHKGY